MAKKVNNEAAIPNPALEPLSVLVGEWETVGRHPGLGDVTLHGHAYLEWLEGGAFLMMHSDIDEAGIPSAVGVIGSDGTRGEYFMLYFDERGVSRKLDMNFKDNVWSWSRTAPEFSQRFTGTIAPDGNTIVGKGEILKEGAKWEKDLDLTYRRVK